MQKLSREDFLKGRSALILFALLISLGLIVTYSTGTSTGTDMVTWTSLERYNYKTQIEPMEKWLAGSRPYIGEINTPNDKQRNFGDTAQWNSLLEKMLVELDEAKADISMFSVQERQKWGGYSLTTYTSGSDGTTTRAIDNPEAQAPVWEKHLIGQALRGFNETSGHGRQTGFSNLNPGVYGEDGNYHYPGNHVSAQTGQDTFQYMKSRGYDHVRLELQWERLQPQLGGPLNATEVQRVKASIADANAAGIKTIIEPHNYAFYTYQACSTCAIQTLKLGDGTLTPAHFYDFWSRMSAEFKNDPGVIGYDLMNEPGIAGNIPLNGYSTPGKAWEAYAQGALNAIRNNGDNKLIYVPTWRNDPDASYYHPGGKWIRDPANNFQYTFHLYFWIDGWKNGGNYSVDYPTENSTARSMGY